MTLLRTVRWPLVKTWLFIPELHLRHFSGEISAGDKIISVIDDLTCQIQHHFFGLNIDDTCN